ncbi:MAG: homocysteine S-methyltransferase family protein [Clostridiales bacterium]|nr:homocysteine S-methyltransferase family protein [Clostridiales bacterium]
MLDELLKRDFVFTDNSNGWILLKKGLKPGQRPDIMNITAPDIVGDLQRKAVEAGSDIVFTNTFGANAKTLKATGYTVRELVGAAVAVSKKACAGRALTALDVGPIGEFIKPFGTLSFDESYGLYREQAVAAEEAGADLVAVETMSDLYEVKAVMRAVKENTRLPLFVMMTFDKSGRTFTGCRPESFAVTAEALGAKAIGINCSLAPAEIFPIAEKLIKSTSLPVIIKPNAGLPNSMTGGYDISPEEFARQMAPFASLGVKIVGGCCGTSSDYIRELKKTFSGLKPADLKGAAGERDASPRICTWLRIESVDGLAYDPSMQKFATEEEIIENAVEQSDSSEKIVTVFLPEQLAEARAGHIIRSVQSQIDKPLYLISDNLLTLSAALHHVTGTPAISSPAGDKSALLAIASKYGAVVI